MTANKHPQGIKVNQKNLRALCMQRLLTVSGLCRRIRRSRNTVYRAVREPERFPKAYALIVNALSDQ